MKVLFITPYYYPNLMGGSERSIKILAEGLTKKGADVSVLSFDGNSKRVMRESFFGVKVIRVKRPKWKPNTLAQNIALLMHKEIVRNEKPDIIHVYNTWHIPASYFLRKYAPVVATLNNYFPICATSYTKDNIIENGKTSFFRMFRGIFSTIEGGFIKKSASALFYSIYTMLIRPLSKRIDAYAAYSSAVSEIYRKNGFDGRRISVISSPFEFKHEKIKKIKRKKNKVLYVGSSYEAKGFYELIEAARYIDNKEIEFEFVGIKELPEKAKEMVNKYHLKINFHKPVKHEELEKFYLESSLLVHPSLWPEPFSRIWIEASYYDIPIISADNPVALDILKDGAVFYKRGHPKELAEKIKSVLSGKLKTNTKKIKERIFSEKPVEKMINLYNKVIG